MNKTYQDKKSTWACTFVPAVLGLHEAVPELDEAPEAPGQSRRRPWAPEVQVQLWKMRKGFQVQASPKGKFYFNLPSCMLYLSIADSFLITYILRAM